MTKSGATAKAKRYAERMMENMTVITDGISFEVIHTEYLEEYIEDGWQKVASYKYDMGKAVKV